MARVQRTIPGTSYNNPAIDERGQNQADPRDNDGFFDTADRVREQRFRAGGMHETSDSMVDGRNVSRASVAPQVYKPPTNLDAPAPRKGFVQRWVRASFRTENDNLNWQSKTREGWMPRSPSTIPEHEAFYGSMKVQGIDVVSVGGLVLMEIEEEKLLAKRKYIRDKARQQEVSVIQETEKVSREVMRAGGAPIIREETDEVRTGRRPATMAN